MNSWLSSSAFLLYSSVPTITKIYYCIACGKVRWKVNHWEQRKLDLACLNWLAFLNLGTALSQKNSIEVIELSFTCWSTFSRESFLEFIDGCFQVILNSAEAKALWDISETDFITVGQKFGIILHQTLQSSWWLEGGLSLIGVLGINEFRNVTFSMVQCIIIGANFDSKWVDVPRI